MWNKFYRWYMKCRIVKITFNGEVRYQIQQRDNIFVWWWVSASTNCVGGEYMEDTFDTLEQAEAKVIYYDGTKEKIEVVKTYE